MQKQYGVIPFIRDDDGINVVLITSAAGYWIFPKGRYEADRGKRGTAELEAREEAGVEGRLLKKNKYKTKVVIKGGETASLTLYAMEVESLATDWPEKARRKRKVVAMSEAMKLIDSEALRNCLEKFSRDLLA